jgi:hypothetical protein
MAEQDDAQEFEEGDEEDEIDEIESLQRMVMRSEMRACLLEMDLRSTQLMLLRMLHLIDPDQSQHWKDCFVERRREQIERMLIQWEKLDPQMTAEVQDLFEDDFEDWLTPNPDPDAH